MTIMGVVLVIQPDFIFKQSISSDKNLDLGNQTSNNLANESQIHTNQSLSQHEQHNDHGIKMNLPVHRMSHSF